MALGAALPGPAVERLGRPPARVEAADPARRPPRQPDRGAAPARNEPDLDEVPAEVRNALTIHLVSDAANVLARALEPAQTTPVQTPAAA
jgi:Lon protease (S16) C-terminal proteolytic domain